MEEPTETLALRLKLARRKRGYTQVELAKMAGEGVQQSDISKLERGDALATSAIARLARALRVSSAWLEENEGPIPDWNAAATTQVPEPISLSEAQLVDQLRPEWRELILAYNILLPEDQATMAEPMLKKAAEMRKYLAASLAKFGVQPRDLDSTGNKLPAAPPYPDKDRRAHPRTADTDFVKSPLTHNEEKSARKERKS